MDVSEILKLIPEAGATGLLVYFIVAVSKGTVIFKREYENEIIRRQEIEKERNDWRELALRGTDLAEGLAQVQTRRIFEK